MVQQTFRLSQLMHLLLASYWVLRVITDCSFQVFWHHHIGMSVPLSRMMRLFLACLLLSTTRSYHRLQFLGFLGPSDWNFCSSSLLQTRNNVEERFTPILIVLPWAFHNPYIPWGDLSLGERERERDCKQIWDCLGIYVTGECELICQQ